MLLHFHKNNMYCFHNTTGMSHGTPSVLILLNHNGMSSTKKTQQLISFINSKIRIRSLNGVV